MLLLVTLAQAAPPADVIPHRKTEPYMQLHAQLRPMGFSPDGKLGMLYIAPDEAVGCMQWSFVVHDLVTDKVVARHGWNEPDRCDESLAAMWQREESKALELFGKHGIVVTEVALTLRSDAYRAHLVTGAAQLGELQGDPSVTVPVRVMLAADEKGEKQVGELQVSSAYQLQMTWGHEVIGMLESPYEPRVAVLVREIHRGWEGLPTVEQVHVMGASLEKGF